MTIMLKDEPVVIRLLAIILLVVKQCGTIVKVSASKMSTGMPGKDGQKSAFHTEYLCRKLEKVLSSSLVCRPERSSL